MLKTNKEEKNIESEVIEIDAEGQVLGRLATKIATVLRGKDQPNFRPNVLSNVKVKVINASKIVITGRKIEQKVYQRPTLYLGHLKTKTMKELMQKDPSIVLEKAVYGMLPKNKLRKDWLKNLEIKNGNE